MGDERDRDVVHFTDRPTAAKLPAPRNLAAELVDLGNGWHISPAAVGGLLADARQERDDALHELDVLRGLNTDLQQRLDLALATPASKTHVAVPRKQWRQVRAVVDAAKVRAQVLRDLREFGSGAPGWAEHDRLSDAAILAAVDALDEDDPREVSDATSEPA